jgi:hypothetical protein
MLISPEKMALGGRNSEGKSGTELVEVELKDGRRTEWHQLWISLRRWQWSALAVVPASPSNWPMRISRSLARVGSIHVQSPVQLLDVTDVTTDEVSKATEYIEAARTGSRSVVVSCPHPTTNEISIPVVLAADAVLLAVVLGESSFKSTQQVLELFGPRIIGSVVVPND